MELHKALSERMEQWICIVRPADGRFMYANTSFFRMFRLEPTSLDEITVQCFSPSGELSRIIASLVDGEEAPIEMARVGEVGASAQALGGRAFLARAPRWGTVAVLMGTVASRSELPHGEALRTDTLTRVCHGLRGPLHVILGFAQLLRLGQSSKGRRASRHGRARTRGLAVLEREELTRDIMLRDGNWDTSAKPLACLAVLAVLFLMLNVKSMRRMQVEA